MNHLIRRIDIASGTVTTLAGLAGSSGSTDGVGTSARFNGPYHIAMDAAGTFAIAVGLFESCNRGFTVFRHASVLTYEL